MTQHVVMFSGGIGSWAAAKRVAAAHGKDDLTLFFTDTLIEDEDLYRFIDEGARDVFGNRTPRLVRLAEGRDPWQVFFDERMLGNSRIDPCSKILKRRPADRWLADNFEPGNTTVYVGIDWSEEHRFLALRDRRAEAGWHYEAPLCDAPYITKSDVRRALRDAGIRMPRLYELGFEHNNCGGFCIKAGHAHFANLLRTMPERYAYHEQKEQDIRAYLKRSDIAILTDRRMVDGEEVRTPITLRDFRLRIEAGGQYDMFAIGGCGCFAA
jgi:3'-phosphoadenosine 5'-phosphosulfate sulfotransferase (PAPS reductase)/FAD synthetase